MIGSLIFWDIRRAGISHEDGLYPTQTLEERTSNGKTDRVQLGTTMIFFTMQRRFYYFGSYLRRGNGAKSASFAVLREFNLQRSRSAIRFRILGSVDGVFYAMGS